MVLHRRRTGMGTCHCETIFVVSMAIEETNNKEPLGDVWVFDTFLCKWFEIEPKLLIQGSSAGKKIKKVFEPRLAHSAVILDQYVIVFGGFNSKIGTLISNDLYVLTLNGESNCILPKSQEKKQLQQ